MVFRCLPVSVWPWCFLDIIRSAISSHLALRFVIFRVTSWIAFRGKDSIHEITRSPRKKGCKVNGRHYTMVKSHAVKQECRILFSKQE